jgi:hypothetical protein
MPTFHDAAPERRGGTASIARAGARHPHHQRSTEMAREPGFACLSGIVPRVVTNPGPRPPSRLRHLQRPQATAASRCVHPVPQPLNRPAAPEHTWSTRRPLRT